MRLQLYVVHLCITGVDCYLICEWVLSYPFIIGQRQSPAIEPYRGASSRSGACFPLQFRDSND